jgi:CRP-like cAMP-binding protein
VANALAALARPAHTRSEAQLADIRVWVQLRLASLLDELALSGSEQSRVADTLSRCLALECIAADRVVFRQGDASAKFFVVVRGRVSVWVNPERAGVYPAPRASERVRAKQPPRPSPALGSLALPPPPHPGDKRGSVYVGAEEGAPAGGEEEDGVTRPARPAVAVVVRQFVGSVSSESRVCWFGELGLVFEQPRSATVRAEEECVFATLDARGFAATLLRPMLAVITDRSQALARFAGLATVPETHLAVLAAHFERRVVPPKHALCDEGDAAAVVFFVLRGECSLWRRVGSLCVCVMRVCAPCVVGDACALLRSGGTDPAYQWAAQTESACEVLAVSRDELLRRLGDAALWELKRRAAEKNDVLLSRLRALQDSGTCGGGGALLAEQLAHAWIGSAPAQAMAAGGLRTPDLRASQWATRARRPMSSPAAPASARRLSAGKRARTSAMVKELAGSDAVATLPAWQQRALQGSWPLSLASVAQQRPAVSSAASSSSWRPSSASPRSALSQQWGEAVAYVLANAQPTA